ncbi:glycosyltransferase family 2 protein [Desulfobacter vibrioformis]|uniref:glycosyltransferase family 2 protein n=1 Tax=Desulfobacter vibrioformis TaxID=34031 RepID=UPI000554A67A|nr:glycosyltransferase family 2 protein [Desulfobacter vibrioformis]
MIAALFNVSCVFISLYIGITTCYLFILTIAAFIFKKKSGPPRQFDANMAPDQLTCLNIGILIPAHNESFEIVQTVRNIKQTLNYPKSNYNIIVIADNCQDDTAQLAREAGAQVVERSDLSAKGKGQALDWFFKSHKSIYLECDAVVIIDADTIPHPNFLNEICQSFSSSGVDVVQGFYGVSNPQANWRTALASAALSVFHHIRPAGRNQMGGTAGLKGNGMAFKTKIVDAYGWPAYSVVEDIEYSLQLLMDGVLVHYNPDAIVYAEMASGARQAGTQRKRWEGGRVMLFKKYLPPLIKAFIKERKSCYFDGIMELLIPPLSLLVMAQTAMFICAVITSLSTLAIWVLYPQLWIIFLCMTVFYIFSGLILRKAPFYVWRSLCFAPFFIIWKIPLYFSLIKNRRSKTTWERTQRESEKMAPRQKK